QKQVTLLTNPQDTHHLLYAVVYHPNTPHPHQHFITPKQIQTPPHPFINHPPHIHNQHHFHHPLPQVVQSYIPPSHLQVRRQLIRKASSVLLTNAS
ncbi:XkdF-like putative serine protease domain-containing protein, partial [Bacillus pumilus]|uniref:XkdF-like putative serine protease domain-containing protein n=1 Tax=Bacillus pumilus TaxID=1408 RepID=UPI0037045D3C